MTATAPLTSAASMLQDIIDDLCCHRRHCARPRPRARRYDIRALRPGGSVEDINEQPHRRPEFVAVVLVDLFIEELLLFCRRLYLLMTPAKRADFPYHSPTRT